MYEKFLLENDLTTKLYRWETEEPQAVIQLCHGMAEHVGRYEDFAKAMNEKGIIVVGHNMRGHGIHHKDEAYGFFAQEHGFKALVNDAQKVTDAIHNQYPNLPIILLGHSMGSIVLRIYLKNGTINNVKGAIVSGTMDANKFVLKFLKIIVKIVLKIKGERHRSKLLNTLVFLGNNNRIANPQTTIDWLTSDQEKVQAYKQDDYSGGLMPAIFFKDLLNGLLMLTNDSFKIDIPLLFITGKQDPVGNYGKDVKKVIENYSKHTDVTYKFYTHGRHEVLNEKNNKKVYNDIYNWVTNLISR